MAKQNLEEQAAQMERINVAARQLVALTDKPELGIRSWWRYFGDAMIDMEKEMVVR
jgi:hypothetical protein